MAGIVAGLALASPSSATLLGNAVQFPLISFDNGGATTYDAGTDLFSVNANPVALRAVPATPPLFITPSANGGEDFLINIFVGSDGSLIGGVSDFPDLLVTGDIDVEGDGTPEFSGVLLAGEVTGFGYQNNVRTDLYDFTFTVTGGLLAEAFGPIVGVSLQSERSTFTGEFAESFAGQAKGTLGAIPEPGTLMLLGAGLLGLATAGKRRATA